MPRPILRVSLVIPAYNEESHLAACLDAIAAQTVRPFEVIVVDNNSTDQTAAIARSYPFVRLLQESRQGVVFARDTGFNAARGDIIARTDGDTILASDWVQSVHDVFTDPAIDAVSGVVSYRDVGLKRIFGGIDTWYRHFLARRTSTYGELFLYGVNMAMRRSAWKTVRTTLCHKRCFAEDLDVAIHLARAGRRVAFAPAMRAIIVPRQAASDPREFYKYVWSGPRTYAGHSLHSQKYMYPMAIFVLVFYVPIRLLYKGYNPAAQRFSLAYVWHSTVAPRVSPVSELI